MEVAVWLAAKRNILAPQDGFTATSDPIKWFWEARDVLARIVYSVVACFREAMVGVATGNRRVAQLHTTNVHFHVMSFHVMSCHAGCGMQYTCMVVGPCRKLPRFSSTVEHMLKPVLVRSGTPISTRFVAKGGGEARVALAISHAE